MLEKTLGSIAESKKSLSDKLPSKLRHKQTRRTVTTRRLIKLNNFWPFHAMRQLV